MKLRLNVATAPQTNHRPFVAASALIGGIALVVLLVLARAAYTSWQANLDLRSEMSRLQDQIRDDQSRQQDLAAYFKTPGAEQILGRSEFLNSLIGERSFPWTRIFMDLENTLPPGVRVVSISPKLVEGKAEVTMVVGATSDESKLRFLEAIEKSKSFSGITVSDERVATSPTEPDHVQMSLTFWYEGAA